MKTFIQNWGGPLKVLIITAAILLGTQFAFAWTQPGCGPTGCNVAAPLNVSSTGQIKDGGLTVAAAVPTGGIGFVVANGKVGIGTTTPYYKLDVNGYVRGSTGLCIADDCRTAWPGGGTGTVGGTGTLNYVPKWTPNTSTLGNSQIFDNGTNVGVGTAAPTQKLDVNGGLALQNKLAIQGYDTWLRLNPSPTTTFTSGIYAGTGAFRTDGLFTNGYASNYAIYSSLPGGATDGDVWFGHDITIGKQAGSGIISGSLTFPGGSYITGNYNTANGSDVNYGNVIIKTKQGFLVSPVSGSGNLFTVDKYSNVTAGGYYYSSDRSLKTNIEPLKDALSKVLELQGVSFNWKSTGKASVGVVAQDVEKVYPELVDTDPKTGLKSVEYGNLVGPLIEAVKEQQKEIDNLQAEIKELQNK